MTWSSIKHNLHGLKNLQRKICEIPTWIKKHLFVTVQNSIFIVPESERFNPLSANPTKWSNTLKQFVYHSRQIVWVRLTILWGWRLKC